MNLFTIDELKILMNQQKAPCVSIFLPTHRTGAETQADAIRFKNLLREAERGLLEHLRSSETKELLQEAEELIQNRPFWQHQSDGLAIFISPGVFSHYHLPLELEELVVVGKRFHIKPLLPLLSGDGRFYVLAISQNEVRLFQGTRYSVSEVKLKGVPENLAETLRSDDPGKQIQFHTGTPRGSGKRAAIFYGHGGAVEDAQDNILRYLREIDKGLHELLRGEQVPLVLAGVDYLFSIYREANTYPHLFDEGIAGNPDRLSVKELHHEAWTIVQTYFHQAQQDAVDQYRQFAGTKRASNNIREIVPAAYNGRVKLLFVAVSLQRWGRFDPNTNIVHVHQQAEPEDEELLDLAATETLFNSGSVYAVEPEKVPDGAPLAAVFRY